MFMFKKNSPHSPVYFALGALTLMGFAGCPSSSDGGSGSGGAMGTGGDAAMGGATGTGGATRADTAVSTGGTPGVDAAVSTGGATGTGGSTGATTTVTNNVGEVRLQFNDPYVSATFKTSVTVTGACQTETVGACSIVTCPLNSSSKTQGSPGEDAGAMSVTVGATPLAVPSASYPNGQGIIYQLASYQVTDSKVPWSAGDMVTIAAVGATSPAFSTVATIPGALTFTAPAEAALVDRSKDLLMGWTGSTPKLEAQLSTTAADGGSVTMTCFLDGKTGSATIPAAALGKLPVSPAASLIMLGVDDLHLNAGAWTVHVSVTGDFLATYGSRNLTLY